jgi:hypothetical protein
MFSRGGWKTAVRFFDHTGEFTTVALNYQLNAKQEAHIRRRLFATKGIKQWWYARRHRKLSRTAAALKEKATVLLEEYLSFAARRRHTVGFEKTDFSFREARQHELQAMRDTAFHCTDCWFFVFKPNDLCADKNVGVASIM